ncbi:NTP transferase domain-containing protein [Aureimonas leprariae]|uniref:NTP transferase domain-containing protein n=1 Tax=Plantimonas leprariae TaxID=2615207 RepID=A0A7V7PLJ7_9HYPH|nr:NTP transferase domain-containing protein [Aureimonas leprariae]KAB0677328.1 NTP transferase domain-containing protein [Aureimonas leprariae]
MSSNSRPEAGFAAIVLAAQRRGHVDPLAAEAGISHKCMVPIAGVPLIVHVASALLATAEIERLRIVVEPEMEASIRAVLPSAEARIEFVPAADNLADSVYAGADGIEGRMVITTADNVLLSPKAVRAMLATLSGGADAAVAFARRQAVLAAHPEGQRRFYRFADDSYSNCNLYAFAGARALAAAESFRGGGQFAKKPLRMVLAFGVVNVAVLLLFRPSLTATFARLSRRFGLRIDAVVLDDGANAIDVDNRRTYDVAATLLAGRDPVSATGVPAPSI